MQYNWLMLHAWPSAGAKLHADVGGRTSHYSLYRSRQAIPISQTNSVNQKEMKR
jgi:hypothetical protein